MAHYRIPAACCGLGLIPLFRSSMAAAMLCGVIVGTVLTLVVAPVVLELESRKPVEILRIQYSYFAFDSQGHLREDEREKKARLSMDMIKPMQSDQEPNLVIDARYKFAKKRFAREYMWEPSPEVETAIFKEIFG